MRSRSSVDGAMAIMTRSAPASLRLSSLAVGIVATTIGLALAQLCETATRNGIEQAFSFYGLLPVFGILLMVGSVGLGIGFLLAVLVRVAWPQSWWAALFALASFCIVGGRMYALPVGAIENWAVGAALSFGFAIASILVAFAYQWLIERAR